MNVSKDSTKKLYKIYSVIGGKSFLVAPPSMTKAP